MTGIYLVDAWSRQNKLRRMYIYTCTYEYIHVCRQNKLRRMWKLRRMYMYTSHIPTHMYAYRQNKLRRIRLKLSHNFKSAHECVHVLLRLASLS